MLPRRFWHESQGLVAPAGCISCPWRYCLSRFVRSLALLVCLWEWCWFVGSVAALKGLGSIRDAHGFGRVGLSYKLYFLVNEQCFFSRNKSVNSTFSHDFLGLLHDARHSRYCPFAVLPVHCGTDVHCKWVNLDQMAQSGSSDGTLHCHG
jgi:hypothetical protein